MSASRDNYLFLGVGGMGMAPLAGWLAQAEYPVSGYDDQLREPVRRYLTGCGVEVKDILIPEFLSGFTTVVHSTAVGPDHFLLAAARRAGLRTLRRGELLAEIAAEKKLVAVAGSHGKTTTSGMIAHALHVAGAKADYILGGFFADPGVPPARHAGGEWLLAEVDESDGTIEAFAPEMTLLMNIDWDHPDRYGDAEAIGRAFGGLMARTRLTVFLPAGGPEFALAERLDLSAELRAIPAGANETGRKPTFNHTNAAAAAAVLEALPAGVQPPDSKDFPGMARRQSAVYEDDALVVVEDYAHHPRELDALFAALRSRWPERRLDVVFQPHRYSRTAAFKDGFVASLSAADSVHLLPVYAAHEAPLDGGRTEDLAAAFGAERPDCLPMGVSGLERLRASEAARPRILAFVGAGDIGELAHVFVSLIRREDRYAAFLEFLRARVTPDCVLKRDEPLANKTTMRVGGNARLFAEPACLSDLKAILEAGRFFELERFFLGRGSNLVVADAGFEGLVIRLNGGAWRKAELLGGGRLWVGGGVRLKEICGLAAKAGVTGFEFLEGIPGSVGGALRMNAGAMGGWMFDVVERVLYLDETGRLKDAPRENFHFGYRKVEEISRGIALGAVLGAPDREEESAIRGRMDTYASTRKESQPRQPSAGCIFKNPEGDHAGRLIDELGLKGWSAGGAEVSDRHGNFIVNRGGATASDVIELVRRVRAKVREERGYELEPEVLLLGASWDEVLEGEAAKHG